jgi:hypothetical protein
MLMTMPNLLPASDLERSKDSNLFREGSTEVQMKIDPMKAFKPKQSLGMASIQVSLSPPFATELSWTG